jgi:hypothetical protein
LYYYRLLHYVILALTHARSCGLLYVFVFCTIVIYEIVSKLVFEHVITSSLGSIRYCSVNTETEPNTLSTEFFFKNRSVRISQKSIFHRFRTTNRTKRFSIYRMPDRLTHPTPPPDTSHTTTDTASFFFFATTDTASFAESRVPTPSSPERDAATTHRAVEVSGALARIPGPTAEDDASRPLLLLHARAMCRRAPLLSACTAQQSAEPTRRHCTATAHRVLYCTRTKAIPTLQRLCNERVYKYNKTRRRGVRVRLILDQEGRNIVEPSGLLVLVHSVPPKGVSSLKLCFRRSSIRSMNHGYRTKCTVLRRSLLTALPTGTGSSHGRPCLNKKQSGMCMVT